MFHALVQKLLPRRAAARPAVRQNPVASVAIESLETRQMMSISPTPLPLGPRSPVPPIVIVTKPKVSPTPTPIPVKPTSPILQK